MTVIELPHKAPTIRSDLAITQYEVLYCALILWSSLSGHYCLVIIIIIVWSSPWSSQVGDLLELNCTSEPSHPPSQLRWEINKEEVRQTISNLQTVEFYFNWYQIICLPGILFMFAEYENLLFFVQNLFASLKRIFFRFQKTTTHSWSRSPTVASSKWPVLVCANKKSWSFVILTLFWSYLKFWFYFWA